MKFIKKNWKQILLVLITILLIISTIYTIFVVALYKGIETKIRIVGCITLIVLSIFLRLLLKKFKKKHTSKVYPILALLVIAYTLGLTFVSYKVNNVYNKIAKVSNEPKYDMYSTSIITRSDNNIDIKEIKDKKIARISDTDEYEGYTLANKLFQDQGLGSKNIIDYYDYTSMLKDLLKGKIDYAVLPTNYVDRYENSDGLEELESKTRIIISKEEKKVKTSNKEEKKKKSLNEPFTVLIMGVDTVNSGFSSGFNGDALLLVTFNPKTTNATILSIPRDTYMPLTCLNGRKNKITNAGWHGQDCIINSIEQFFGIEIDYHIKINFNGVVSLVDALGGVEVDVPYAFCEQNSKRKWGKNTVFVNKGKQVLNGEQALAFARHRKVTKYMVNYCGSKYVQNGNYWNDFVRGQNQQIIINALLKKFKDIDNFSTVENLLNTISKNMETDIPTDSLFSLYDLGKGMLAKSANKDEAFLMQKLYISGHDATIFDYSYKHNAGSKLNLYNYVIYEESLNAVVKAMKENLELVNTTPIKTFSYSIQKKYVEFVIGKNMGSTSTLKLMPNFVGKNISVVQAFAASNNINLSINYITATNGYVEGQVMKQSVAANTDLDMLNSSRSLLVNVAKAGVPTIPDDDPTNEDDNSNTNNDNNTTNDEETN